MSHPLAVYPDHHAFSNQVSAPQDGYLSDFQILEYRVERPAVLSVRTCDVKIPFKPDAEVYMHHFKPSDKVGVSELPVGDKALDVFNLQYRYNMFHQFNLLGEVGGGVARKIPQTYRQ